MFQTDLNHFLQSFDTPVLTGIMQFITNLGYAGFFILFLAIITFAVDFKKGFIMLQLLLWTAVITDFFKNYFAFPRPFHIDPTLKLLDGQLPDNAAIAEKYMGATRFFSSLPQETIEHFRNSKEIAYALPSGHTSIAAAIWGAMMLLFSQKWVKILSLSLIILVPLSRMYLGVHFLGDVLGGYIIGFVVLAFFYLFWLQPKRLEDYLNREKYIIKLPGEKTLFTLFLFLGPFLLLLFVPYVEVRLPAYLFGFNVGFLLLAQKRLPSDHGLFLQKALRVMVAIVIFVASDYLLSKSGSVLNLEGNIFFDFVQHALGGFLFIWGGTMICLKTGLCKYE